MNAEEIGSEFIRLGLSIDRHFVGYVDSYFGPEEIARAVNDGSPVSLEELETLADGLAGTVANDPSLQPARREYLRGEISAMLTTIRILSGHSPGIVEEVRSLYGVTPAWVPENTFAEAHRRLERILPGGEPLAERVRAFREKMRVPTDVAAPIIRRLASEFRARTRVSIPLPANEGCTFVFVHDKPWAGYNRYLGQGSSRIEVNQDRPLWIAELPYLVAHEAYPGHHTENAVKEAGLYGREGRLEHSILLSNAPSALVSEGIAEAGLHVITSSEELVSIYRDILAEAGLPADYAPRLHRFMSAIRDLDKVRNNQLLLLHERGAPDEEVIAYGMEHGLNTEDLEKQLMRFYRDPLWRSNGFNYSLGRNLVEAFLSASAGRLEAFSRLLESPMTPEQLSSAAKQ